MTIFPADDRAEISQIVRTMLVISATVLLAASIAAWSIAGRVLSVALFEHVEAGELAQAHRMAAGLVLFSMAVLLLMYRAQRRAHALATSGPRRR